MSGPWSGWGLDRSVAQLGRLGVTAYPDKHGRLVVSATDFDRLKGMASVRLPTADIGRDAFMGVPIASAPDWTCDPKRVELARLVALFKRDGRAALRLMLFGQRPWLA